MLQCLSLDEGKVYREGYETASPTTSNKGAVTNYNFNYERNKTQTLSTFKTPDVKVSLNVPDVVKFDQFMTDLLDKEKKPEIYINIVVYLWDSMFRMHQKDKRDVIDHIVSKSLSTFNSVNKTEFTLTFPPPHPSCVEPFLNQFGPGKAAGVSRLIASVSSLVALEKEKAAKTATSNIRERKGWLAATHLLSLSGAGLGLVTWVERASEVLEITPTQYLKTIATGDNLTSIGRMILWSDSTHGYTYPWARLINESAFAGLRLDKNKEVVGISAILAMPGIDLDTIAVAIRLIFT